MLFKRAEQYANEYRSHEREEIRMKRLARHNGELYVPAQPKVYFVIRIRGCVIRCATRHANSSHKTISLGARQTCV